MEKIVWLFERGTSESSAPAAHALQRLGAQLADEAEVRGLGINVVEALPALSNLAAHYETPANSKQLVGVLSTWVDSSDQYATLREGVDVVGLPWHAYLVSESVPVDYPGTHEWLAGVRSPGVTLVAAFRKPEHLSDVAFYSRWHDGHTPLSLEVHPLCRYLRNSVVRPLSDGAPTFRGIVEERVWKAEDLTPETFYAGRQAEVGADFASFSDVQHSDGMRITLMSEYIFKQPWAFAGQ